MTTQDMTKEELIDQLHVLQRRIAELELLETDRVREIAVLRQRGRMLRSLLHSSPEPTVIYDAAGRVVFLNAAFTTTFGWTKEELQGRRIDYVPDEFLAETKETLERSFKGELVPPFDTKRLTKDGRVLDVHISSALFRDDDGQPAGHIVTLRDLSPLRRSEEALRENEKHYQTLIDSMAEGVIFQDSQYVIRSYNPAAEAILGVPADQLVGKSSFDTAWGCIREDGSPYPVEEHPSTITLQTGRAFTEAIMGIPHEDRTVWISINTKPLIRDGEDLPHAVAISFSDITGRKEAEEALQKKITELNSFLNNIPDMAWLKDVNSNFIAANKAFGDAVGMAPEYLVNHTCEICFGAEAAKKFKQDDEKVMAGRKQIIIEESIIDASKNRIWLETIKSPILDASGNVIGTVGVARNITERKLVEQEKENLKEQLFQAQKMETLGTLAGGIAHDFNNLLTIINGFAEMILMDTAEDDPRYRDLQKILETGQKGATMTQRLLVFSKKAEISLEPLNLSHIIKNSVDLMERTFPKMIEIETILGTDLGMVNADALQVEQVLMNLCINAQEAMPEGGRLKIETRNMTVDEEYCRLHVGAKPGNCVLLEVSDTGAGMDAEALGRIFDPFFTTKGWDFRKGTGLGLSVVKGIVEQHSGWITCQSEPGKGATFTVYFPAIEDTAVVQAPELIPENVPGIGKILVVDDEEYVRDLGKRILERSGCTVITASNGREALDIYAREQSNITLVILDLIMPQMGGEKCLEELTKINPRVKVVLSTGHSLDPTERAHLGALAKAFVNKPYEMKQFLEVVSGVLGTG